ncbi:MAG: hypothetical protein DRJ42_26295 [Deltaproteobacteria bacterium]|nr:MAG: hypothetical protein DRJ42_26295 [Deltaproteobacteria bacterium]
MRSFLLSLIVVASLPLVTACEEEAGPAHLTLNYQVACTGCTGVPVRQISTLNGVEGNSISCSVSETEGQYLLNLSFSNPNTDPSGGYGFDIRNAVVSTAGGPAQSGTITIIEQDNRFGGRDYGAASGSALAPGCGDEPPTACATPCRLYDISFEATPNGPAVLGSLECDGLPLAADRTRTAEVHAPTAPAMPANFLFENCTGLQL